MCGSPKLRGTLYCVGSPDTINACSCSSVISLGDGIWEEEGGKEMGRVFYIPRITQVATSINVYYLIRLADVNEHLISFVRLGLQAEAYRDNNKQLDSQLIRARP